jgi:hypothetical protein
MRYLRMLTNAIAGGVLIALYLGVLVLQLNPQVSIASSTVLGWFGALLAMYGPYVTVVIVLMILGGEAVVSRPLHPGWLSVRILAWLSAAMSAIAAVLMWTNLEEMRSMLSAAAAERMRDGATATTVCAIVLGLVAILRYSFGRRGNRPAAVLMVASVVGSLLVPMFVRGPGELKVPAMHRGSLPHPVSLPPRVRMLLIDGASRGFLLQRVSAGQLPNFGKLIDRGATIDLATLQPTQAEPVWTAAATGKYPPKNGARSEFVYHVADVETDPVDLLPDYCFAQALLYQGFVQAEPITALARRARPLWDILADYGVPSGIINWPLTRPAEATYGFLISDYFDEATSSPIRSSDTRAGDPTTAVNIARPVFDRWLQAPMSEVLPTFNTADPRLAGIRRARWDRAYVQAEAELIDWFTPRLTALRLEGIDEFGHAFLREAESDLMGGVPRVDPDRSPLDRYYAFLDGQIERAIAETDPGDLLIIASGFGQERTPLAKRLLARLLGEPDMTGTHENAPDGFLIAYGTNVQPGEFRRGSVVDLAPTILYYMGIPIGRDMDGFARTDLFRITYTQEHPAVYTLTHER